MLLFFLFKLILGPIMNKDERNLLPRKQICCIWNVGVSVSTYRSKYLA